MLSAVRSETLLLGLMSQILMVQNIITLLRVGFRRLIHCLHLIVPVGTVSIGVFPVGVYFVSISVIRKEFRPLHFFHILFRYSLILKLIKYIFLLIIQHTIPHNDNAKQVFRIFC